ncbi:hypothetical protein OG249_03145 [Streptomyces microflavus]|uniref:hypothetical protein n=1 Tax=Streptomyces microflavus TaxID=1919 RepID=UPI0022563671|nr:hypothetical protein [Streptomyces microflavus]MCX4650904.1 hypothetical protein [Streptomyces microflavus]
MSETLSGRSHVPSPHETTCSCGLPLHCVEWMSGDIPGGLHHTLDLDPPPPERRRIAGRQNSMCSPSLLSV